MCATSSTVNHLGGHGRTVGLFCSSHNPVLVGCPISSAEFVLEAFTRRGGGRLVDGGRPRSESGIGGGIGGGAGATVDGVDRGVHVGTAKNSRVAGAAGRSEKRGDKLFSERLNMDIAPACFEIPGATLGG